MLKPAMIFNNRMVLQRGKPIPIWGEADPGQLIHVKFHGNIAEGKADKSGKWEVILPACAAGCGYAMEVCSGEEKIVYSNILVGDVWIAGGQSNMEFFLGFEKHYQDVLKQEKNSLIRFFDYPEVSYEGEMDDFSYVHEGFWRECTNEDLPYYSAVAYYFAEKVQPSIQVPVGIIGCNWGGMPACVWMDPEKLKGTAGEIWLEDYEQELKPMDMDKYVKMFKEHPLNNRTNQLGDTENAKILRDGLTEEQMQNYLKLMSDENVLKKLLMPAGPYCERRPGGLYETMLKKIVPYAMKGVIWYQGESDGDIHADIYEVVFTKLIENWRNLWQEDFPFLFVQIAPLEKWLHIDGSNYVQIREAQYSVSKKVKNAWMATSSDAGMRWDIHPKDKKIIGERLALLARKHVYGEEILSDAPEAIEVKKRDSNIVISFTNAEGLHIDGESLQSTFIKSSTGEVRQITDAKVYENRLVLLGCEDAVEIQFAQTAYYKVNVYNEAKLPALPFTLEVVKCSYI